MDRSASFSPQDSNHSCKVMLTVNPQSFEVEPGTVAQEETFFAVGLATLGGAKVCQQKSFFWGSRADLPALCKP